MRALRPSRSLSVPIQLLTARSVALDRDLTRLGVEVDVPAAPGEGAGSQEEEAEEGDEAAENVAEPRLIRRIVLQHLAARQAADARVAGHVEDRDGLFAGERLPVIAL